MGGALVSVLVLVELDGGEPADASLRALTLARSIGDVRAVVFADVAPQNALAGYGVTDVYLVESSSLEGYAPQAWPRAPTGATRCWRTWARSPACRWRPTAPWSPRTRARRTGWSGTAGPGCSSRTR